MIRLQVQVSPELERKLKSITDPGAARELKERAFAVAEKIRDEARRRAPYDEGRRRGRHLRDAIFAGRGRQERPDVLAGVNRRRAPHAHLVEFGTRIWAGKPFWRPTLAALGPWALAELRRAASEIIGRRWS